MFQSNVWPDMTAPDDSSVLIDLVLATQHQMVTAYTEIHKTVKLVDECKTQVISLISSITGDFRSKTINTCAISSTEY